MFQTRLFKNKHILVGVTGGIAAYKSCELVRALMTAGADVRVMMTGAAEKFVTPLTFETLSQNPVAIEMFPEKSFAGTHHIKWADWAGAAIIAPASYNFIGKLSSGIADDLVTTISAALACPMVIAPAMNVNMWNNQVLQKNLTYLAEMGKIICPPEEGFLAEGYSGMGRLAPLYHQLQYLYRALHPAPKSLEGKRVLITAGRTEEALDPVRFLTNRSSGKMGLSLAIEAFARGAEVTVVHGPLVNSLPASIHAIPIRSAAEMENAVLENFSSADYYISAAAIADYTPVKYSPEKIKKSKNGTNLKMKRTTDVLKAVSQQRTDSQILVGFAVETNDFLANAGKKLQDKKLDLVVINNPLDRGAGFQGDTNKVTLLSANGDEVKIPLSYKLDVAFEIFNFLLKSS